MTKFSLFLLIIPITILVVTFPLIIIIVHYSVVRYFVVRCFPVIIFIYVRSRETCHKFIILPVMGINNRIFKCVSDWERRKPFN